MFILSHIPVSLLLLSLWIWCVCVFFLLEFAHWIHFKAKIITTNTNKQVWQHTNTRMHARTDTKMSTFLAVSANQMTMTNIQQQYIANRVIWNTLAKFGREWKYASVFVYVWSVVRCGVCLQKRASERERAIGRERNRFLSSKGKLIWFFDFKSRVQIRPPFSLFSQSPHYSFRFVLKHVWIIEMLMQNFHSSVRICQLLFFSFKVKCTHRQNYFIKCLPKISQM